MICPLGLAGVSQDNRIESQLTPEQDRFPTASDTADRERHETVMLLSLSFWLISLLKNLTRLALYYFIELKKVAGFCTEHWIITNVQISVLTNCVFFLHY